MSNNVIIRNRTINYGLVADLDNVDVYGEWTVRNDCGRSVFVLRQSGAVQHIASTTFTGIPEKYGVTITELVRSVSDLNIRGCTKPMNDLSNRQQTSYTVLQSELERGPVYIPQLGIAIGFRNDQSLRDAHPYACGSLQDDLERNVQRVVSGITSVLCSINTYDKTVKNIYTIVNGGVVLCGVSHDVAKPEGVVLRTTIGESHAKEDTNLYTVTSIDGKESQLNAKTLADLEVSDKDGNVWYFSIDRDALVAKLQKKKLLESQKFTETEVKERVKRETEEIAHENRMLKENNEILAQRVTQEQNKRKYFEDELNGRNTATKRTHEEYMSEMKLRATEVKTKADSEIAESKVELARMSEEAAKQSKDLEALKAEVEKTKAAADEEVARTKVDIARLSKESAEKSSVADTVKAAAVIIPAVIAIGAGIYAFAKTNAAATATAGCVACSAPPAAVVLATAAAATVVAKPVTVLVTKTAKTVAKGVTIVLHKARKALKTVGTTLMTGAKKGITIAVKGVTGLCKGAKCAAKTAISCGKKVVKAAAKAVKKVFNRGKEVVAGAARTAASVTKILYNKGKQVVTSVYDGVKTCVSKAADVVSGCARTVCDTVSSIYSGCKSVISNVCDTISSWFW